jgi:hypothetical protein
MASLIAAIAVIAALGVAATGASAKVASTQATGCANGISDRINGRTVCIRPGGKCIAAHNGKYRARNFNCVNGRLRRYTPPEPQPTPPPPPPVAAAMPGHYEGRTSQNEIIKLDVQPGGVSATGLDIHTVNESCNPSGGRWGGFTSSATYAITTDGTLTIDTPTVWTNGGTTAGRFTLRAAFTGIVLTGNLTSTTTLTPQGTPTSCSSGLVTFTAMRQ